MIEVNLLKVVIVCANFLAGVSLLVSGLRAIKTGEVVLRRKWDFILTDLQLPLTGKLAKAAGTFGVVSGIFLIVGGFVGIISPAYGLITLLISISAWLVVDLVLRIQHKHYHVNDEGDADS